MTAEIDTAVDDEKIVLSKKAVVAGRWKLLRDALRGKPVSRQPAFKGYDMICSQMLQKGEPLVNKIKENLCSIVIAENDRVQTKLIDTLETSLLSLFAIDNDDGKSPREKEYNFTIFSLQEMEWKSMDLMVVSSELCRRCDLDACQLIWDTSNPTWDAKGKESHAFLQMTVKTSNKNRFMIRRYELMEPETFILVRERSPEQIISLAELTSHHRDHAIDNTGNVCVWDCEKILLWAIRSCCSNRKFDCVLELGAGMAGLVALGLGACKQASHVVVTDGNPGSLQSNRTHVRLMENLELWDSTVNMHLLPWALHVTEEDDTFRDLRLNPADLSVVSDCTHFERYHGHLLWTLIQCTATGGEIWMCHPDRGRTLERFLDIVRMFAKHKNRETEDYLLSLEELDFPQLDEKHKQLEKNDFEYRPNVHRPRIFRLTKLREATEKDRSTIIDHMARRDSSSSLS